MSPGTYVPTPPAFCNHLPVLRPTMFIRTAIHSVPSVTGSTKAQLSLNPLPLFPKIKVAMTAAEISRFG